MYLASTSRNLKKKDSKPHPPPPLRSHLGVLTMERRRLRGQRPTLKALEVNSPQKGLRAALKMAILRLPCPPHPQQSSLAQCHPTPEAGLSLGHPSPLHKARLHKSQGSSLTFCHSEGSKKLFFKLKGVTQSSFLPHC